MRFLKRSNSSESVKSTESDKNTAIKMKYKTALRITNVYVMVASVVMMIAGPILITSFYMDIFYEATKGIELTDFWYFATLPWLLIGIGAGTMLLTVAGFVVSVIESRPALIIYACLLTMLVIFQLVFSSVLFKAEWKVTRDVNVFGRHSVKLAMKELYASNLEYRKNWDWMQINLMCCGFKDYKPWEDFRDIEWNDNTDRKHLPKSCCKLRKDCTLLDINRIVKSREMREQFNMRGCNSILQKRYETKIPNVLLFIEIFGAINILAEIIVIALTAAFVAHITRTMKSGTTKYQVDRPNAQNIEFLYGKLNNGWPS